MATGAAAGDGLFRCVFEGCISSCDSGINKRPYHRNCGCALHKSKSSLCAHARRQGKKVSYPMRRSWSEGCLALAAATSNHNSGYSSPSSSSPAPKALFDVGTTHQSVFFIQEDDED